MEHEKAEQARKKKFAPCLQLIKSISSLPAISDEELKNHDWNCESVEKILKENELIVEENSGGKLIHNALVNDKFMDQFLDFMIDEWKDPTISELVYILVLLISNKKFLNNLLKRRHVMRICYFVLAFETKLDSVHKVFQQFLENYNTLSLNVLCSILHDELRKFKDFKRNNYNFSLEMKCLELLQLLRVKYPSESLDSTFQSVLVYLVRLSTQVSKNLCSQAIIALKNMKAKSKASFGAVKKAFEAKAVNSKVAGTLVEYCKATNTEEYFDLSKPFDDNKEISEKIIGTGTDVDDFIQDIDVDPKVYSITEMNKHLEETILRQATIYIHSQFIRTQYGSVHHQEVEEEKEFQYLAKAIIRVCYF